jgi:hypothetical protein
MSKRARCPKTGCYVRTVRPWPALDVDVQAALPVHVFTGPMKVTCKTVGFGTAPSTTKYVMMCVRKSVKSAALVSKAWKKTFGEWFQREINCALKRAWAIAINEGLELCHFNAYNQNVTHQARGTAFFPVHAWLPRKSQLSCNIFFDEKIIAKLTLTRSRADANNPRQTIQTYTS